MKRAILGASILASACPVGAAQESDRASAPPALTVINTGLCASILLFDGTRALVTVRELSQGVDLNGDGDIADAVLHVLDLRDGTALNLGVTLDSHPDFPRVNPFPFNLCESDEGRDLNGDGDTNDCTLHVVDMTDLSLQNLGSWADLVQVSGGHVDFTASPGWKLLSRDLVRRTTTKIATSYIWESTSTSVFVTIYENLAGEDLNGDGDLSDTAIQVFDRAKQTLVGLPPDVTGYDRIGDLVLTTRSEILTGNDFNRDGDELDSVLHVWGDRFGRLRNLGFATKELVRRSTAEWPLFVVDESEQGGRDIDGDGDALDDVLFRLDPATLVPQVQPVGLPTPGAALSLPESSMYVYEDTLLFQVSEGELFDHNGDGDGEDLVLCAYDLRKRQTTALGGIQYGFRTVILLDDVVVFGQEESDQGHDLNGDGDSQDAVIQVFDPRSREKANTGLVLAPVLFHGDELPKIDLYGRAFVIGDEQRFVHVLHFDPRRREPLRDTFTNVSWDCARPRVLGDWVITYRDCSTQLDFSKLRHAPSGIAVDVGLHGYVVDYYDGTFLMTVFESEHGDLNGDGDTADGVTHLLIEERPSRSLSR